MDLVRIDDFRWKIPRTGPMRVPGIIYSDDALFGAIKKDETFRQVANVATLPGIVKASFAMPDIHWGYGFPIGGVAAFDWEEGVISPGGVGYDINCGVRLAGTDLEEKDVRPRMREIVEALFREVPCGVGSKGSIRLSVKEERKVLLQGASWGIREGFGTENDLSRIEDEGCMENADPDAVSEKAFERGLRQLGTLGSGNHFLEIGFVDKVFDEPTARVFGLFEGQVTVLLHSGSRGFGYQVCDDYLAKMTRYLKKHPVELPDRQLVCAKIQSSMGKAYFNAMACAANYAWANRQVLMHLSGEALMKALGIGPAVLRMRLVYDLCHNIAKRESHVVDGKERTLCVHRKGATRAFPAGRSEISDVYRKTGHPILIPGDMGTASYVLVGTQTAENETFGSTCHGAGRLLSRKAAKKASRGRAINRELEDRGILVKWTGRATLAEEMPDAYKDVSKVVQVAAGAGISRKVARLRPLGVIKG